MENNTSLLPDTLKTVVKDYKNSFLFIFKNKWLYLIPIFFVFCGAIAQNSMRLYQKILFPDLYKFSLNNLYQTAQQPFSEKLVNALFSIHLSNILSSLSLLGIFNLLGVAIAFFFLYKKIKNLRKFPFVKKVELYSFFAFLLGLIVSILSYLFFKNIITISLGVIIGIVGIQVLLIILFTIIEAVFISFLKSLLYSETFSLESISSHSEKFIKPLFLFNIVLSFVSSAFLIGIVSLPDMLNYFVLGGSGNFVSSIPQIIFVGIIPIIKYLNAFFAIIFIFTPFILAINSTGNLFSAMCENISLIKRKLDYYLWLILIAILFSIILSVTMELLNPSSKSYLNSSVKELAYSAMRSLIFNFFLLTFFITGFRSVINFSRRSDYLKNKSSKSF